MAAGRQGRQRPAGPRARRSSSPRRTSPRASSGTRPQPRAVHRLHERTRLRGRPAPHPGHRASRAAASSRRPTTRSTTSRASSSTWAGTPPGPTARSGCTATPTTPRRRSPPPAAATRRRSSTSRRSSRARRSAGSTSTRTRTACPFPGQALLSNGAYLATTSLAPGETSTPLQYVEKLECQPEVLSSSVDYSGDLTEFWRVREYRPEADRITAATLFVHGLADFNVLPITASGFFDRLPRDDAARRDRRPVGAQLPGQPRGRAARLGAVRLPARRRRLVRPLAEGPRLRRGPLAGRAGPGLRRPVARGARVAGHRRPGRVSSRSVATGRSARPPPAAARPSSRARRR